jgi:hypothetical protein
LHGIAGDSYETKAISFFRIFVDEATGEYACHFGVIESRDFLEIAAIGNAAVFRHAVLLST